MLSLRLLITSKYLSVIVFWDFHFLVWNPPLNSSLAFPASCCPQGPASEALWFLHSPCPLCGRPGPPGSSPSSLGPHEWFSALADHQNQGLAEPLEKVQAQIPTQTHSIGQAGPIHQLCVFMHLSLRGAIPSPAQSLMLKSAASHRRVRSCSPSPQQTSSPFSLFKACMSLKAQLKSCPSHRLHHHNLFWTVYKAH